MSSYTPGHALDEIVELCGVVVDVNDARNVTRLREIVTRLYKAGQANEREANASGLRRYYYHAGRKREREWIINWLRSDMAIIRNGSELAGELEQFKDLDDNPI